MYNFEKEYPGLAKEWNYERNKKKPSEYLPNSSQKVWWKCKKGHSLETSVCNRTKGTNCPICWKERHFEKRQIYIVHKREQHFVALFLGVTLYN